jgi:hypothetical protein
MFAGVTFRKTEVDSSGKDAVERSTQMAQLPLEESQNSVFQTVTFPLPTFHQFV